MVCWSRFQTAMFLGLFCFPLVVAWAILIVVACVVILSAYLYLGVVTWI